MMLIFEPTVTVVAKTQFDFTGLESWALQNGYGDLEENSPLCNLVESESYPSPELIAEFAGRFCYNSFSKGRPSDEYLANVVEMRHGSILEHVNFTFAISGVSRALTHELIRHRAGFAVSQESQRYVDAKDIKFVVPPLLLWQCSYNKEHPRIKRFEASCARALADYKLEQADYVAALNAVDDIKEKTVIKKRANEAARSVLPNSCETKLTWTGNMRALRHVLELRGDSHADLEIRRLAAELAQLMLLEAPYTFNDITIYHDGDFGVPVTTVKTTKV
jgi:thymidylate synthase (FAD)